MKKIVVFASGSGTNAENLIRYFEESDLARVVAIFTNNAKATVIERAYKAQVPCHVFANKDFGSGAVLSKLQSLECDFIALAGFLKKVPANVLEEYKGRIVNSHPALLPRYGGAGMYGKYVHQAVVENEEEVSGITIHHVTEDYDEGETIFQEEVEIDPEDTWQDVEYKVRQLEYKHYPEVVEYLLKDL